MSLHADKIIGAIGTGVSEALRTNRVLLGVDKDTFENADIHPEYVVTVEVAKQLAVPDWEVVLEMNMKDLRKIAGGMARNRKRDPSLPAINEILGRYQFGKKDSKRVDIVVQETSGLRPPLLIAEAKLGVQNLAGVIHDVDRVVKLLRMYRDLQLLPSEATVYGAVLFHYFEEGDATGEKAKRLLSGIENRIGELTAGANSWLKAKKGLLTRFGKIQPVQGYTEVHPDGTAEEIFAKDSFTFAPGLVLLGNAADVETATF